MYFTGKDDGPSIEEYIKWKKIGNPITWKIRLAYSLMDDACIWWDSYGLNCEEMMALSDEAFEKLFLEKWSHTKSKDKERT
jgi:hypothetical protein